MLFESFSYEDTIKIAFSMAQNAKPGDVYCLSGDLGTGKTVFSKGFAKGLGLNEDITSPTFTIINEYKNGRLPFYHFDVYRVINEEEMEDIGYEEYFYGNGVCIVEWAELINGLIPESAYEITISKDLIKDSSYRNIKISKRGEK